MTLRLTQHGQDTNPKGAGVNKEEKSKGSELGSKLDSHGEGREVYTPVWPGAY